jgi:hypothetical protein
MVVFWGQSTLSPTVNYYNSIAMTSWVLLVEKKKSLSYFSYIRITNIHHNEN